MKKLKVVSVWLGNGNDDIKFSRLLEYHIGDGGMGEFEPSAFCRALNINRYDPDGFGGKMFPKKLTKPKLLFWGTELVGKIEERFAEVPPSNCVVLLYCFEYDGAKTSFEIDGFQFQFLGCFQSEAAID